MSQQQKAFAKFPAMSSEGAYHYIDIFTIESIGQSATQTAAVIFTAGSDRYYTIEVSESVLAQAGEPDAASWALTLVSRVAALSHGVTDPDYLPVPPKGHATADGERV